MKECKKCKEEKGLSLFPKNRAMADGLHYYCKECTRVSSLNAYHRGRQDPSEDSDFATREKLCTSCNLIKQNKDFGTNNNRAMTICKECKNLKARARRYSMSKEQLLELLKSGCQACGSFEELCIDHDHSCCHKGQTCGNCVRGVLCKNCNTLEGILLANKDRIPMVEKYLRSRHVIR